MLTSRERSSTSSSPVRSASPLALWSDPVRLADSVLPFLRLVNEMVGQLTTLAQEVTRVSLEVGTEGKLGGQAVVHNVEGVWKALTDNVNLMALNLTTQVRSIAVV